MAITSPKALIIFLSESILGLLGLDFMLLILVACFGFVKSWLPASDATSIRVKDLDEVDLSGNVLYKSVFGGAVGYSYGAEIVWLLTTTA